MTGRIAIAAALVLAAVVANAQQLPPGKWWRRTEVVQQLGLTAEQQDRLDEIFRSAASGLIDAKAEVEKAQVALRGEIDRADVQRQDVMRVAAHLNAARGALFERELAMLLDMRAVLSREQWNRMREHLDRMHDRERGRAMDRHAPRPRPGPGRSPAPRGRRP